MDIIILGIFLLYSFVTTCSYAFYEIFSEKNKLGGFLVIFIAILGTVLPIIGLLL